MTEYTINDIYQGGTASFSPNYGETFTGYHIPTGELGAPTKADAANQIAQVNALLNQGIIPIEAGVISPEIFDQIPKHHFKEINRMAKLTGAKMSVHAPIVEASGITQQGWNEYQRQAVEEQLKSIVDRTMPLNEKQGASITIHSTKEVPGTEWIMTPEGKKVEKIFAVNKETGKLSAMFEEEIRYYPEGKEVLTPDRQLKIMNSSEWSNSLSQLIHHKEEADRIIAPNEMLIADVLKDLYEKKISYHDLPQEKQAAYTHILNAETYLDDAQKTANSLFDKAYKYGTDDEKATLDQAAKTYREEIKGIAPSTQSVAMQNLIVALKGVKPKLNETVDVFAREKSAETFANVALHAMNKAKQEKMNAPMINIENVFPGMAFSDAASLSGLVEASRKKFVEKAKNQGFSESEAKEQASKILGVTLDVGHLNIHKKKGYSDKDLEKEAAEIAKFVKHVHLTDNFGYSDSHLPPGMGNVPMKEIMEKLGSAGFKGSKIVEAGNFVGNFGVSPMPYAFEAMGGAIYQGGPTWQQTSGLSQGYSGGFGNMLPQVNYQTFGAKFSQLPTELGGSISGQGSRMSGKPME